MPLNDQDISMIMSAISETPQFKFLDDLMTAEQSNQAEGPEDEMDPGVDEGLEDEGLEDDGLEDDGLEDDGLDDLMVDDDDALPPDDELPGDDLAPDDDVDTDEMLPEDEEAEQHGLASLGVKAGKAAGRLGQRAGAKGFAGSNRVAGRAARKASEGIRGVGSRVGAGGAANKAATGTGQGIRAGGRTAGKAAWGAGTAVSKGGRKAGAAAAKAGKKVDRVARKAGQVSPGKAALAGGGAGFAGGAAARGRKDNKQMARRNRQPDRYAKLRTSHNNLVQEHGALAKRFDAMTREKADVERYSALQQLAQQYPDFVNVDEEAAATLYSQGAHIDDGAFQSHLANIERYAERAASVARERRPEIPRGNVERVQQQGQTDRYAARVADEAVRIYTDAANRGETMTYDQAKEKAVAAIGQ